MSNQLPLNLEMAALPPNVSWSPQQLADAIAARMVITTQQTFALFVTGSTAPSSNVGPWLKNGNSWWVWSDTAGAYVPITLDPESMRYDIGSSAPDPADFDFWIETTAGGSPVALKIYYSGAWVDVYATTLSSYLTIAGAALLYQPLNANLTTLTTSTLGDIVYSSATNTFAKLAGNTTTTRKFLRQTGTGAVSAAPAWDTLVAGDIPDLSATYLTVAAAAAGYQPLNANLTTLVTSTLGDIIYSSATDTLSKLAGNTAAAKRFLTQTGNGAVSAAPGWNAIVAGDIPDISATYKTVASFNTDIANYSTTAQMNTAISNALAVVGQGSFSARPTAVQNVVFGGAGNMTGVVTLGTEDFDPDSVFAASTFTAPAAGYYQFNFSMSLSISGGTPTELDILTHLAKNGSAVDSAVVLDGAETKNGGIFTGVAYLSLAQNDTVDLRYDITSNAAVTAEIQPNYTRLSGFRVR